MIEISRDHSANVKRWRDGQMALRWCAAGMGEAAKQFRFRLNECLMASKAAEPLIAFAISTEFLTWFFASWTIHLNRLLATQVYLGG